MTLICANCKMLWTKGLSKGASRNQAVLKEQGGQKSYRKAC